LGRKERYVLAMALLLVVGLSAAWAGYNGVVAIGTNASGIAEFAVVTPESSVINTLSNLKKNVWFTNTINGVFTISSISVSDVYVVVGVTNMAELQEKFKSLDINVTLKCGGNTKSWGVISLEGGVSSVLLNATNISSGSDLSVDVIVQGRPSVTGSARIIMYCTVQPAKG
jgi:hypothetical protein